MPITRTPIVDDDGSGTTGSVIDNAWKQELYNQIDALVAGGAPVYGTFTATDGSGAGLAFSSAAGSYAKLGRVVTITLQVIWPATASGASAKLAGLPFLPAGTAGFHLGYGGVACRGFAGSGLSVMDLFNMTTGAVLANSAFSGANITLHGTYLTT